jgi:acetylornithine deacetylase/succinyl-diaminopimelate desuccinylase-like protein
MEMINRRSFIRSTTAAGAALVSGTALRSETTDVNALQTEIEKHHDENVRRIQDWIRQPSIAAENRGMNEGCDMMMQLLRDAGFDTVNKVPTEGHPGVFATLDAGAPRTVGIYFMYDVKQVDPSEWSSPPWDAALVDKPGLGKVVVGRGAVNTKGPQAAFLAALHAFKSAGRKPPVNLVFVAEGEEEIGSPHFPQIVRRPETLAALRKCLGVFMPMATQALDGSVTINLGAKGVVELELVSSAEKWGRGPKEDLHSSNEARVDSPAWHLIEALATLVGPDGHTPAVEGFLDKARPLTPGEKTMIREATKRMNEAMIMKQEGVQHWVHNVDFLESQELLVSKPTINIEGLVGGYTGPGGKTVLPHKAVAKIDMRLVPNLTAESALTALKSHLQKHGFGDIEVNMTGGYNSTSTAADSALIRAEQAVYKRSGYDPILWPRLAGSWPGYVFTDDPVRLPAGHFGLGLGNGAHAPNEYYVIESANPKIKGLDGAVRSHVDFLYELATVAMS